ncbi:unnamed protein product [Symbiodinium sp. KB8]|nr:unnamed protein product [Symbiodinium sp. KB8]
MLQTDENAGVRSCLETISGWDISASTFRTLVMSSQVRILEARGLGFPWAGRAKSGSGRKVVRFHSSDPKALALAEALGKKKAELGSAWRPGTQRLMIKRSRFCAAIRAMHPSAQRTSAGG